MNDRGGRFCEVLYKVAVFFAHMFSHYFAMARALKQAAFPACEPQTSDLGKIHNIWFVTAAFGQYPELVHPGRCRLVVLELKQEAAGAKKQQGSSATSPKPEPAKAQTPCAKPSPLPSSRDGPPSLLMPPSPPLQQTCYARTPPPTTTWMASSHHAAKSSPKCHVSPLPPAEPQPPLKEHGLDLATPPLVAWRLTSKTVISLPGDWPVQQSKTETLQKKGARKKKKKCKPQGTPMEKS